MSCNLSVLPVMVNVNKYGGGSFAVNSSLIKSTEDISTKDKPYCLKLNYIDGSYDEIPLSNEEFSSRVNNATSKIIGNSLDLIAWNDDFSFKFSKKKRNII